CLLQGQAAGAFLFFQAEDGIRDFHVTGVQTCALPICALALDPPLMLWDEPTAALDPILVAEVLEVMEDLARSKSTGMLVVTHEVGFALRAADRVVLLEEGAVVDEGPPEQVFGRPRTALAQRYARLLAS